jgi:superfamily I DNA/RNA helicase
VRWPRRIERGEVAPQYDAVIIDEAQDLQPAALRALVSLCKTPSGLFLTADANQSIYGGSFRWQDVHASLKFQGHTGVLRANHRSTREIGEGAEAYLADGTEGTRASTRNRSSGSTCTAGPCRPCARWRTTPTR